VSFVFRPTGQTFELDANPNMGELMWANRTLKIDFAEIGDGLRTLLCMYLTVRRTDKARWTAKRFEELTSDDFEMVVDDDPDESEDGDEPDPTVGLAPAALTTQERTDTAQPQSTND